MSYFVAIWKDPNDLEKEFELVSVHATDLSMDEAEKLVTKINGRLGLKEDGMDGFIGKPGGLCAMYDHMEDLPKEFR